MASRIESPEAVTDSVERRDFLFLVTGTTAAIGLGAIAWPLIDSMNPSADVLAAGAPVDIDVSGVQPGQQITRLWRSRPVFIAHRTPAELSMLQQPRDAGLLSDPNSEVHQQPSYAQNWHRSIKPDFLILVGICTHLGCIPRFEPSPGGELGSSWPGGYFWLALRPLGPRIPRRSSALQSSRAAAPLRQQRGGSHRRESAGRAFRFLIDRPDMSE
jgi:ubiquinol-cytochrome c reductase iron-sulfur subunit